MGISVGKWLVRQGKSGIEKKKKYFTVCKRLRFKTSGLAWTLGTGPAGLGMIGSRVAGECVSVLPTLYPKLVGETG